MRPLIASPADTFVIENEETAYSDDLLDIVLDETQMMHLEQLDADELASASLRQSIRGG